MRRPSHTLAITALVLLGVCGQACRLATRPVVETLPPSTAIILLPQETVTAAIPAAEASVSTPKVIPSSTPISTPTAAPVSITAVNGDLAIRAGPDITFDAIDRLKEGQTLAVVARSVRDGWLEVPLPSQPGALGWVSTQTGFSQVNGYVLDLPTITKIEWPFGAYLRNCTEHQLVAEPGDTVLPPANAAPANRVWFFPGLYTVYDTEVEGRPPVTQVKLAVHADISVISDGAGTKYTCP